MTQNGNGHQKLYVLRAQPMYSFSEAAHLAHVSTSTVRNWLFGYGKIQKPLFRTPDDQGPMVSFLQLIEIVVAGQFRKAERVSFQRVRSAYENGRERFQIEHPFAHLQLEALGGHIVSRMHDEEPGASIQALDEPELWTLPGLVLDVVHQLEYLDELASRWFPAGKDVPIVVDPLFSAGVPTIAGFGVTIPAIRRRWKAGHRIEFIARDFQLESEIIETALQYAEKVAA